MKKTSILESLAFGLAFIGLGIGISYYLWISSGYEVFNFDNFYEYFSENGFGLIILWFLAIVGIYILYSTFVENVFPPKKDILFLKEAKDRDYFLELFFIDKNGKILTMNDREKKYKVNKYYEALVSKYSIKKIIGVTSSNFEIKEEKKKFWLTWYSPMGCIEKMFLLPILYVIFLPGLFSFLMSEGFVKIYGLIWMIVPGYFIIYDLVHKFKK